MSENALWYITFTWKIFLKDLLFGKIIGKYKPDSGIKWPVQQYDTFTFYFLRFWSIIISWGCLYQHSPQSSNHDTSTQYRCLSITIVFIFMSPFILNIDTQMPYWKTSTELLQTFMVLHDLVILSWPDEDGIGGKQVA